VEVAVYGGTFTALERSRQDGLLGAVQPFLENGTVHGLRLSTRPDALEADQVAFLTDRGVTTVEIGAQSMDDRVLAQAGRGHTSEQIRAAARRVLRAGLGLGLQLLVGLPGEDAASRKHTLAEVLALAPHEARLYPLLALRGTVLARRYEQGAYRPLDLAEAVSACADYDLALTGHGVRVIRIGLQNGPELDRNVLAGPYHPAFGHLVRAEIYRRALGRALNEQPSGPGRAEIFVSPADHCLAVGHAGGNRAWLTERLGHTGWRFRDDPSLDRGWFRWRDSDFFIYSNMNGGVNT
jgi:histone acetyltransferase (RNA polymerase elongator complex component)